MGYTVLVKPNLSKDEYTSIFSEILSSITSKDRDIDEIILLVFDDKDLLGDYYSVALVQWCPNEGWNKVTPQIARNNDRKGYQTTIYWDKQYELKFKGLRKTINEALNDQANAGVPRKFRRAMTFDEGTGTLNIVECFTDASGREWAHDLDERRVYVCAWVLLEFYPLNFTEIKKYDFSLLWKDKKIFILKTDRQELDSLSIKQIYKTFENELVKQEKLNGVDVQRENKLELKLYYHKIFSHFKNKELHF
jgi:hypothetical protein